MPYFKNDDLNNCFLKQRKVTEGTIFLYFLIKCHLLSEQQLALSCTARGQINISVTGGLWKKALQSCSCQQLFFPPFFFALHPNFPAPAPRRFNFFFFPPFFLLFFPINFNFSFMGSALNLLPQNQNSSSPFLRGQGDGKRSQFEPIPLAVTFDSPGRADAPAGQAQ